MECHFLGTGSGIPSKSRNVSALVVRFLQQKVQWLFDCGEATQHQILSTPVTLSRINRIFISHLHGDHIFGLPGLLCSRSAQGAVSELTIYGPSGLQEYIETSLSLSQSYLGYSITYVIVEEGVVYSDDSVTVEALSLDHVMPSFAYKITECDKPGTLQVNKLKELGIEPGPIYQKIKNGESVSLSNGVLIESSEFLSEPIKGRSIVIAGDTRVITKMATFSSGVDLLIHEGTFSSDKAEHAEKFGHSTISEVANLAKTAKVKKLILTHISSRYVDQEEELLLEATSVFDQSIIAHDYMIYRFE